LSQFELALEAGISARHLSFVENGRSAPSRDTILRLAEELDLPLRERNHLLLAAGYAPVYSEAALDSPEMSAVRGAVRQLLTGHEPYPAVVVDRSWNLVDANESVALFTEGADSELLAPPANVLRISLHPEGMAPRIANLGEWRAHLLGRLRRQVALTADPDLDRLGLGLPQRQADRYEIAAHLGVVGEERGECVLGRYVARSYLGPYEDPHDLRDNRPRPQDRREERQPDDE